MGGRVGAGDPGNGAILVRGLLFRGSLMDKPVRNCCFAFRVHPSQKKKPGWVQTNNLGPVRHASHNRLIFMLFVRGVVSNVAKKKKMSFSGLFLIFLPPRLPAVERDPAQVQLERAPAVERDPARVQRVPPLAPANPPAILPFLA